jgi:hypothetical protein
MIDFSRVPMAETTTVGQRTQAAKRPKFSGAGKTAVESSSAGVEFSGIDRQ